MQWTRRIRWSELILGFFLVASPVMSGAAEELKIPPLTSPVMDEAGVIGSRQSELLERILRAANERGKVQLTVLTLPTLQDQPIEQVTIKIVEAWKLGAKGKDNGVLFLIVPSERKARIEVGQGLEGDIPDVIAKRILADVSKPYFRKGLYSDGIVAGTVAILQRADPDFTIEGYAQQAPPETSHGVGPGLMLILFIVLFILRLMSGRYVGGYRGGGWWGGGGGFGGGSGGGWSGGGGGFSGGGSSDSW